MAVLHPIDKENARKNKKVSKKFGGLAETSYLCNRN